ncbi:MAG: ferric reductase-like transmembrane domain-containing protein [Betaproteobacteria bacterium]|nr:ferric reductase-like transmembrane domain-containing protein [Betaproteobacteria bacterium]
MAGADRLIDLAEWQKAFESRNALITRRLFRLVDADGTGFIDEAEYFDLVACLLDDKTDRRLRLVFAIYDLNDDGAIDVREIGQILQSSLEEQSLKVPEDEMAELSGGFFRYFKKAGKRALDCEEFIEGIRNYKKIDRLFAQFTNIWLPGSGPSRKGTRSVLTVGSRTRVARWLAGNWQANFWVTAYIAANALLFLDAFSRYAAMGASPAVQIARGFGACLNLNVALVLLPVTRSLWTRMRHLFIGRVLPVDSLTDMHRGIGWFIVIASLLHTAAHSYNYWKSSVVPSTLLENSAFLTGVLASLILILMLWGVAYRSGRNRERFSGTHMFYGAFIVVILLHGPRFWMWLLLPGMLFVLDGVFRRIFRTRRVKVLAMQALPDGATLLRFSKPARFGFYPGDYLRLRVPVVSKWEWHPFTISASPEASHFEVHVRNNGDWSGALHNLSRKRDIDPGKLRAWIDGPYGAPTSNIYRSPVAVMIAGGIGVTPFASALGSLVMRSKLGRKKKDKQKDKPEQIVYFHWLNRAQSSYEWFQDLLLQAEEVLGDKFRLYIHLTSFSHNLTNIAMQIATEEFHVKHQRDPFTSLHAVTNPGRPNWSDLFAELARQHPGYAVDVYYCGPQALAQELHRHCGNFGFYFHEERFD